MNNVPDMRAFVAQCRQGPQQSQTNENQNPNIPLSNHHYGQGGLGDNSKHAHERNGGNKLMFLQHEYESKLDKYKAKMSEYKKVIEKQGQRQNRINNEKKECEIMIKCLKQEILMYKQEISVCLFIMYYI